MTGIALISAPAGTPSAPATSSTVVRPGVGTSRGSSSGGGSSTGCGSRRGDLDVGRVAGRERDLVLARRARRHVVVGAGPAHHPDVGLDPVPAQPAAVEDPVVGLDVELVAASSPSSSRSKL